MRHISRQLLAGLGCLAPLLLAGCAAEGMEAGIQARGTSCGLRRAVSLPITLTGRAALVTVTVNQRQAQLLFDTGANVTALSPGIAAVLGVVPRAVPPSVSQAVGGTVVSRSGVIDRLDLGGFRIESLPVSIVTTTGYDGVLGLDVLTRFDVDVDIPGGAITLHDGGLCSGQLPPMGRQVLELPTRRLSQADRVRDPFLVVPVQLDTAVTTGMLDTGAMVSVVSADVARQAGVTPEMLKTDTPAVGLGFGTSAPFRVHRFGQASVGREYFVGPTMMVGGSPRARFPVVLGFDYFAHHRVWFNFASDRIFVVPQAAPHAP